MPYFKWHGVDLQAATHKGYAYAESVSHLDTFLFKKNIALLAAQQKNLPFWHKKISMTSKIQWLEQLALLLQSGVHIVKALHVIRFQCTSVLYESTTGIIQDVERGIPLHQALNNQEFLFDNFIITMACVGAEAGNLAGALGAGAHYLEQKDSFVRKIRMAALVPAITLIVFFIIMAVIVTVIIPKFVALYGAMHQELPFITQVVVAINQAFSHAGEALFIGAIFIAVVMLFFIKKYGKYLHRFYCRIPLLGSLFMQSAVLEFVSSCALLVQSGMPLVSALKIAHKAIGQEELQKKIALAIADVEAGIPLSVALALHAESNFSDDALACIVVAEETGTMSVMLKKIAFMIQEQCDAKMTIITTLFQPLLIIILGFFVVFLLMASYMPIFNMSYIV